MSKRRGRMGLRSSRRIDSGLFLFDNLDQIHADLAPIPDLTPVRVQGQLLDALIPLRPLAKKRGTAIQRIVHLMSHALTLRSEGKGFAAVGKPLPLTIQEQEKARMWYYTATPICPFATIATGGMILPRLLGQRQVHVVNIGEMMLPQWAAIMRLLAQHPSGTPVSSISRAGCQERQPPDAPHKSSEWPHASASHQQRLSHGSPHQPSGHAPHAPASHEQQSSHGVPHQPSGGAPQASAGQGPHALCGFRMTNVSTTQLSRPGRSDLDMLKGQGRVALMLGEVADSLGVRFAFQGIDLREDNLAVFDGIQRQPGEVLAVVIGFDLKFFADEEGLGGGPCRQLMQCLQRLRPDVVTLADDDIALGGSDFLTRFEGCMRLYSAVFSMHDSVVQQSSRKYMQVVERVYFATNILSCLTCEGTQRRVRQKSRQEQRALMEAWGFQACHVDQSVIDAEHEMLQSYPPGFGLFEENGMLGLMWKGFPILSTSSWTPHQA